MGEGRPPELWEEGGRRASVTHLRWLPELGVELRPLPEIGGVGPIFADRREMRRGVREERESSTEEHRNVGKRRCAANWRRRAGVGGWYLRCRRSLDRA
jgi:hypothetical protein